ncbi:PhzF family phenazine biosynthesis protein [Pontibacter ummariensis]|uniref:Phenazine biosynthesis protein PhzF family n=1 Tax=Pontibacter ummariensis TaxID=1610492 RepID=A0A239GK49_9BACT|nr:PhzF family phenazine biosynthesis protein [Pontibacter ummariensis]PRY11297.1 PhzF family phenazine biosynthesis protein [Pontibacter ummariensis]SNS69182.1 phenazine biosynthesis protein PhzF family [Pontibacter ummariensis]
MTLSIYQVDAFTDRIFGGNPACVVPLKKWLPDETLLAIAKENAVAETAFFIQHDKHVDLRWFTPEIEMDLCGHATLASAHVLFQHLQYPATNIAFHTQSGVLTVTKEGDYLSLDFPSRAPQVSTLPSEIAEGLNIQPQEVHKARDYVLVYKSEEEIRNLQPDRSKIDRVNLDPGGIIVTAQGDTVDFVSRFFTPQASVFEDPVTGSAHCSLIPFWAKRLGKTALEALQLSDRIGKLTCTDAGDRVYIKGQARTYLVGQIQVEA